MRQRQPRQKNDAHLDFIRSLPCIVCGDNTATEAAHIKYADSRADKRPIGIGEKADDSWTLPQCGDCHRAQHRQDEHAYWRKVGIDPIFYALALWRVSGDYAAGCRIIETVRRVNILARGR